MRPLALALVAAVLFAGCTLRPRLREVSGASAPPAGPTTLTLRVVDADTGAPLPNVPVEAGEARAKVRATSDENGVLTLGWTPELYEQNPLLVVTLPPGVSGYRLEAVGEPPPEAPVVQEDPPPAQPTGPMPTQEAPAHPYTPLNPSGEGAPQPD